MLFSVNMAPPKAHSSLLVAVAEHGDRAAFAELYAYYAPRVKGYLLRGGAADSEVDELVQEAMFRVWSRAATYDPRRRVERTAKGFFHDFWPQNDLHKNCDLRIRENMKIARSYDFLEITKRFFIL